MYLLELDLLSGSGVEIESKHGVMPAIVEADPTLRRAFVSMAHAFGHGPGRDHEFRAVGSSTGRLLTATAMQPYTGQPIIGNVPCQSGRRPDVGQKTEITLTRRVMMPMRLENLTPAKLTPEQRALYDAILGARPGSSKNLVNDDGSLRGPLNAFLHYPAIGTAIQELGAAVRFRGGLSDRARELVILLVAANCRCEFEWWGHARIGLQVGLTPDQLEAVRSGSSPDLADAGDQVAFESAQLLLTEHDLNDDEYSTAREALGETALIEITTLIGYYSMLALQMSVFRVELPAGAKPVFSD